MVTGVQVLWTEEGEGGCYRENEEKDCGMHGWRELANAQA